MYSPDDTIVAISTPPGHGGIGVVRVSGPGALASAQAILPRTTLEPRQSTLTSVVDPSRNHPRVDRVLVTFFPAPGSYTGEDVVEISGHGNPLLLRQIVSAVQHAGARLAEPGEFTFRAFLHGRMDLVQAEAVGDLIDAVTPLQARVAFDQLEGTVTAALSKIEHSVFDLVSRLEASVDFPDEGYHFIDHEAVARETRELSERVSRLLNDARRGRLVREGGQVVILGKPNVGKSTLFNQLLGVPRAIVTDVAGTTRDLLTETLEIAGIPITLVDTAGIRHTRDALEAEGVSRARRALDVARLALLVLDQSRPLDHDDRALLEETRSSERVLVINKSDLPPQWVPEDLSDPEYGGDDGDSVVRTSFAREDARSQAVVREAVSHALMGGEELRDPPAITNLRHIELLERARVALLRAVEAAKAQSPEEFVLADLGDVQQALGEVTGTRTADDVLNRIFSEFCIGK